MAGRLSIAPMLDITTAHFRHLMRLLTRHTTLYTEMLHCQAVIHNHTSLLPFAKQQHPLVLQLGGSEPEMLARAAEIAVQGYHYDEVNLNVGCPSPRVQAGGFGAGLMRDPGLVAAAVREMRKRVGVPVTIKCRLGVDDCDSYEFLSRFVGETSAEGHVTHYIIHARKAILAGLSPAQNRTVPPLMYQRVYRLAREYPHLQFTLNGGINSLEHALQLLQTQPIHGCMLGRLAMHQPYTFAQADSAIYGSDTAPPSRLETINKYIQYIENLPQTDRTSNSLLLRPILNMYHGVADGIRYRKALSDYSKINTCKPGQLIRQALQQVQPIGASMHPFMQQNLCT